MKRDRIKNMANKSQMQSAHQKTALQGRTTAQTNIYPESKNFK